MELKYKLDRFESGHSHFSYEAKETEYGMKIDKYGVKFTEKIKVDVEEQNERYDVSQHRILHSVSILKDFKAVSLRKKTIFCNLGFCQYITQQHL